MISAAARPWKGKCNTCASIETCKEIKNDVTQSLQKTFGR